jgi:hypothetical protein
VLGTQRRDAAAVLLAGLSASMSFPRQSCSNSSPPFAYAVPGVTTRDTLPKMAQFTPERLRDLTDP